MLPLLFILSLVAGGGKGIRCYSDHSGPNSAGGIEHCDAGAVCSSARIIFREEGVLRKAMARQCVSRTPDRSGSEWPWCSEEWAGGDEGGMEVLTCFCNSELCNDNNFLRGKFSEWVAATMARLKAGPTHIMDILITIATSVVAVFFVAVVLFNIPWSSLRRGTKDEDCEEDEDEDEDSTEEKPENQREKVD